MLYEVEENLINIYTKKIFIQLLLISLISSSTSSIIYILILMDLMKIGVVGEEDILRVQPLEAFEGVEKVMPVVKPYKLLIVPYL